MTLSAGSDFYKLTPASHCLRFLSTRWKFPKHRSLSLRPFIYLFVSVIVCMCDMCLHVCAYTHVESRALHRGVSCISVLYLLRWISLDPERWLLQLAGLSQGLPASVFGVLGSQVLHHDHPTYMRVLGTRTPPSCSHHQHCTLAPSSQPLPRLIL